MSWTSSEAIESYDIFKKLADGTAVWVCEVTSVLEARARLKDLERNYPAEYYVCNLADRRVLGTATLRWPELHAAKDDPAFVYPSVADSMSGERESLWNSKPRH